MNIYKLYISVDKYKSSKSCIARNFFLILIYSPHTSENPLNGILNTIFSNILKDAIKRMNFPKDELLWQVKSTNYGVLVSKIRVIKFLII